MSLILAELFTSEVVHFWWSSFFYLDERVGLSKGGLCMVAVMILYWKLTVLRLDITVEKVDLHFNVLLKIVSLVKIKMSTSIQVE